MILLEAARLVRAKADGVVADFVQQDRQRQRASGARRLQIAPNGAVAVEGLPRDTRHALAPPPDFDPIAGQHVTHDLAVPLLRGRSPSRRIPAAGDRCRTNADVPDRLEDQVPEGQHAARPPTSESSVETRWPFANSFQLITRFPGG